jgi:cytochrome c
MRKQTTVVLSAASLAMLLMARPVVTMAAEPDAAKGKEVFEQCSVCHNADSEEKKMGPGLKGLFTHDKLKNGKKVTEANVKAVINAGGNGMPAYADMLSDEEKANLIAYLKTL